jgi:hypothetical protein
MARSGRARIQLVLSDDWELYGDGSGDMRRIQFESLRTLTDIYEQAGLRGSFNAEVMQQLHHLQRGDDDPRLLDLANEWSALLGDVYARGHDVQLHLHPQWDNAQYGDGKWLLTSDWSLAKHPPERVRAMLRDSIAYLEGLIKRIDPTYRCVSFRAGAWSLGTGPNALPALVDAGIGVDTSIAPGLIKTGEVEVDYRAVDEDSVPYYPVLDDARRVADSPQPITCVPTHTFSYTPAAKIADTARRWISFDVDRSGTSTARKAGRIVALKSFVKFHITPTHYVSDLSTLSFPLIRHMLDDIRRKSAAVASPVVPVVLTNHTKDLTDFRAIRRFAEYVARAEDLEVITLRQLADNLGAGIYPVRLRTPTQPF